MKRIMVFFFFALFILLTSCGQETANSEQYPIFDETASVSLSAQTMTDAFCTEETCFVLGNDSESSPILCYYDFSSGEETVFSIPDGWQVELCAVAENGVWLSEKTNLIFLDEAGEISVSFEISAGLVDLAVDDSANVLIAYETEILKYDASGNYLCQYAAPEDYEIGELLVLEDGQLLCQAASKNGYSMGPILILDEKNGLTECSTLSDGDGGWVNTYHVLGGDQLYMPVAIQGSPTSVANLGVIVYGLNIKSGVSEPLFDTAGLGYIGAIRAIAHSGEDYRLLYESEDECRIVTLSKTDAQKQILTVARLESYGEVSNAIMAFNVSSREYYIENVSYSGDSAEFRLRMDLSDGTAPDILPLAAVSYEPLAHAGVLADLTPYLEQDTALQATLNPNILKAVEWENGALYHIPAAYSIYAAYAVAELVPEDGSNWSTETLYTLMEENPQASVLGNLSARNKLELFLGYDLRQFLDLENLTCQLDTPEFKRYLTNMKEICTRAYSAEYGNLLNGFQFRNLRQYKEFYLQYNDYFRLFGFPTDSGSGVYANTQQSFAIVKYTGHEDGAWEFIKFLLGEEYQSAVSSFPVRSDILEARIADAKNGFTGEGLELDDTLAQQIASGSLSSDQVAEQTALEGLTDEEADAFRTLLAQIDLIQTDSTSTEIAIIYEELVPYLNDQKSLDEVCRLMQDRLSIYLSEQE